MDTNDQVSKDHTPGEQVSKVHTPSDQPNLLDTLRLESLVLSLNGRPFVQSQNDSWSIADMVWRDYDFFVCTGGAAAFTFRGQTYEINPGMGLLCPPNTPVRARKTSQENFEAVAQHFDIRVGGAKDFFDLIDYRPLVALADWGSFGTILNHFLALDDAPHSRVIQSSLFMSLIFSFLRDAYLGENAGNHGQFRLVYDIAGKLEARMAESDAVEAALDSIPYSRDYAVRMFRKRFGVPPREYLLRCRLNAARDYLLAGRSVKETAHRIGFADELYFSRFFTSREGVSPREFKVRSGISR